MPYLYAILIGYLCGSFPTAYLLGRIFFRINIFEHGSCNMGATNVYRVLGKWPFAATLAVDVLKGMAPVLICARLFHNTPETVFFAATSALLGHTLSFWVKFKGGKGVATGLGVFMALATYSSMATLAVFLFVLIASGMVSLGSITAAASLPFFIFYFHELGPVYTPYLTVFATIVSAFVIFKHKANIKRIFKGEEAKIGVNGTSKEHSSNEEPGK